MLVLRYFHFTYEGIDYDTFCLFSTEMLGTRDPD